MSNEIIDFLFFLENTEEFDSDIKNAVVNEIKEIKSYLTKKNENFEVDPNGSWFHMWRDRLLHRTILHRSVDKNENHELDELEFNKNINIIKLKHYPSVSIIYNSLLINEELKNVHIPVYKDRTIFNDLLEGEEIQFHIKHYDASIDLLKNFELEYQILHKSTSSIAILNSIPELEKGNLISLSGLNTLGLIFISKASRLMSAESILHESLHNRLHALSLLFNFINTKNVIIEKTPLRDDPRPLYGLFHQTYVLYFLKKFYKNIIESKIENLAKQPESIIKRSNQQKNDFVIALKTLESNSQFLTKEGLSILNHMIGNN